MITTCTYCSNAYEEASIDAVYAPVRLCPSCWRRANTIRANTVTVIGEIPRAAADVLEERKRQIEVEGWTTLHDDTHDPGDLACAGACYALQAGCVLHPYDGIGFTDCVPEEWPWAHKWWKPKDPRRDLVRAAALLIAEIERIDRANG